MRRSSKFNLVDGVVIAAVALLALKLLTFLSSGGTPPEPADPNPLPAFGRVLAYARTNYVPSDVTTTGSVHEEPKAEAKSTPSEPAPAARPPPDPKISPAERQILERLGERRDELQQKASEAEQRERLLEESERRLDQRLDEVKALQQKAEASSGRKPEAQAEGLKNVVTMYETMKPKDAAKVFDRLPQAVLVSVVLQINPRKMAEIMAAMSPGSAEKLTVALATRTRESVAGSANALPPGELPAIEPGPQRR